MTTARTAPMGLALLVPALERPVVPPVTGGLERRGWHPAISAEALRSAIDRFEAQVAAVY